MVTDETPTAGNGEAMPFDEYAAIEAVNWSKLKRMLVSPLHYKHALEEPIEDETDPIRVGRATHTAIFEPHRFATDVVEWTGQRRYGKEWDAFTDGIDGKTILTTEQLRRVCRIRDAVRNHPLVAPHLVRGEAEQVLTWTDPETKLALKCRIDWHATDLILDLKTSRNATDPRAFASDAWRMGYFHQMAFYQRGVAANYGTHPQAMIVAVESTGPHDVVVYRLASHALHAVHEEIDELLLRLKGCMASQQWPGKFTEELELSAPGWATALDETNLDDPDWMKEAG